jgi:ATP-dependent exoDNAse (exonuclease V) beta subunit
MVLASAGTGKTYAISSRLLGLLALGAPTDSFLASTFTRKAAGEILDRVLSRLAVAALDPEEARALAEEATRSLQATLEVPDPARLCRDLLRGLVRDLHRINVGTLDSFFVRIARSYSSDLGMPPEWTISDEPTSRLQEMEALQRILGSASPRERAELVRMSLRGDASRGVHRRLLAQLQELRSIFHQLGSGASRSVWGPPDPSPYESSDGGEGEPDWDQICRQLLKAPLPLTSRGEPNGHFRKAVESGVQSLRDRDWEAFCGKGLASKLLEGVDTYNRVPIPDELAREIRGALGWVARSLRKELASQALALRALVEEFDETLDEVQRKEGAYGFQDVTYLLGGDNRIMDRRDLWYRLDQKARHLLLDEFQDTSRAQWSALVPMVNELLGRDPAESSILVVADPKQSIYGWRGAEPSLTHGAGQQLGLTGDTLEKSYRSSEAVLEFVNQVFTGLTQNSVLEAKSELSSAVKEWATDFRQHQAAKDLSGYVAVEVGPWEAGRRGSERPKLMRWVASRIRSLHQEVPGATMGILVRRNAAVTRLIAYLRELGVDASEEGASTLVDSPAISSVLALLTLADHPGDRLALYQVTHSPLGQVVGLNRRSAPQEVRERLLRLRRDLLTRGYGKTTNGWMDRLAEAGALTSRDLSRFSQLLELAYRWDRRMTLRPRDFVHFVESEAVEAPAESTVRVMTVHRAKGLEFDVVVLPELHLPLTRGRGVHQAVLPLLDEETKEIRKIFPGLSQPLRRLFPDVAEAHRQDLAREAFDALGVLYVAVTRARHALHLMLEADPPGRDPAPTATAARLIRQAVKPEGQRAEDGQNFHEIGDPSWAADLGLARGRPTRVRDSGIGAPEIEGRRRGAEPRTRFLPHRTPSSMGVKSPGAIARVLSLDRTGSRRVGTIIHKWLETLIWYEDWDPDPNHFLELAQEVEPNFSVEEARELGARLLEWLSRERVRGKLWRTAYPPGSDVLTEVPFVIRLQDSLFTGRIDRLVRIREGDRVTGIEVLDYKTDAVAPEDREGLEGAARHHGEQLRVYRQAAAELFGVPAGRVKGWLVFLAAGALVPAPDST